MKKEVMSSTHLEFPGTDLFRQCLWRERGVSILSPALRVPYFRRWVPPTCLCSLHGARRCWRVDKGGPIRGAWQERGFSRVSEGPAGRPHGLGQRVEPTPRRDPVRHPVVPLVVIRRRCLRSIQSLQTTRRRRRAVACAAMRQGAQGHGWYAEPWPAMCAQNRDPDGTEIVRWSEWIQEQNFKVHSSCWCRGVQCGMPRSQDWDVRVMSGLEISSAHSLPYRYSPRLKKLQ